LRVFSVGLNGFFPLDPSDKFPPERLLSGTPSPGARSDACEQNSLYPSPPGKLESLSPNFMAGYALTRPMKHFGPPSGRPPHFGILYSRGEPDCRLPEPCPPTVLFPNPSLERQPFPFPLHFSPPVSIGYPFFWGRFLGPDSLRRAGDSAFPKTQIPLLFLAPVDGAVV